MLFVPGIAHALGLDNLTIYSALNEPLKAEIKFTSLSEKEFRTLDARLIRQPQHFNASALESAAPFLGVGITLVEREPGIYSLLLQSEQPMREPFLRLILEVEWAGGTLVREFTTLIDPRELQAPIEDGMPEFPSVAKVGDLGRRGSDEASSRAGSKLHKSTRNTKQSEVLTGQNASASQPETQTAQESTTETTISEPDVATRPTPVSSQPTPSAQVSIETQRRLIQAEIENWARERGLSIDKEPQETAVKEPQEIVVSDVDVETLPDDDVATETPEIELDRPIPNEPPKEVPVSPEASNRGTLGHDLLMGFIGLVVALILVAGGVLIRIYVRQRRALSDHVQRDDQSESEVVAEVESQTERVSGPDVEDLPEYGDRRSGLGRRQQFVSVEVERRQESRRHQDRLAETSAELDTAPASTMDESEVYMACGHDEDAELLLREALAKNPTRQDLKVKLLAIYQHRNDPKAFDALAKELYSNVDSKKTVGDSIGDIFEKRADERPTKKVSETDSDFDHSIEFDVPDSESDGAKGDNAVDTPDLPDDKKKVDADIFEREIEALAMTIPTDSDTGAPDSKSTPANENPDDAAMESLQVDDFAEIKQAVDRGVDLLEFDKDSDQDDTDQPQSTGAATDKPPRKSGKSSGNKHGKSEKSSIQESGKQEDKSSSQWKAPSTKIDLAKAYIAMGDAERARNILDEVLEEWDSPDGTED
jgi:pilus assembly protein FimV